MKKIVISLIIIVIFASMGAHGDICKKPCVMCHEKKWGKCEGHG